MFGSLEPTPYDLRFTLGPFPIRVSIWFWVFSLIMGYELVHIGFEYLAAWIVVLFVSILIHELGHAIVALTFGYRPRILLYQFGGLAMFEPYRDYTASKSIAISLAGPMAGFLLFGTTLLFRELAAASLDPGDPTSHLILFVIQQLIWVNLWWGLINLLPVLPLDGGQICREICVTWSRRRGLEYAIKIGVVVAGAVAAYAFSVKEQYIAILFALLCLQNVMSLQGQRR